MPEMRQGLIAPRAYMPALQYDWNFQLIGLLITLLLLSAASGAINPQVKSLMDNGDYEAVYELLLEQSGVPQTSEDVLCLLGTMAPSGKSASPNLKEYMQRFPDGPNINKVRKSLSDYYSTQGLNITASRMYPDKPTVRDFDVPELYKIALYKQLTGEYSSARNIYIKIVSSGDGEYALWARLGGYDCDFLEDRLEAALEGYKSIIDENPDSPAVPYAMIGLSNIYLKLDKPDMARKYYDLYKEKYPLGSLSLELEAAYSDEPARKLDEKVSQAVKAAYFIQVGSFSKRENSKACLRKFRNLGYQARMEETTDKGQKTFKVLLGPFENEPAARRAKNELEKSQQEEFLIYIK